MAMTDSRRGEWLTVRWLAGGRGVSGMGILFLGRTPWLGSRVPHRASDNPGPEHRAVDVTTSG
jgi:hypothetical protein